MAGHWKEAALWGKRRKKGNVAAISSNPTNNSLPRKKINVAPLIRLLLRYLRWKKATKIVIVLTMQQQNVEEASVQELQLFPLLQ